MNTQLCLIYLKSIIIRIASINVKVNLPATISIGLVNLSLIQKIKKGLIRFCPLGFKKCPNLDILIYLLFRHQ